MKNKKEFIEKSMHGGMIILKSARMVY
jgi:hypothetical protein